VTLSSKTEKRESAAVIGIYGVGDPNPGELSAALRAAIHSEPGISEIREIPWNEMKSIEKPIFEESIKWAALLRLSASIERAMLVCPEIQVQEPSSRMERGMWTTSRTLFVLAETLLAIAVAIVITGLPLLLVWKFRQIWQVALWLLKLGLVSLACQLLVVGFLAVYRQNTSPFWIAVRRTTLLLLRPWLLAASCLLALVTLHDDRATEGDQARSIGLTRNDWFGFLLWVTLHILGLVCMIWAVVSIPKLNDWASSQPLLGVLLLLWVSYILLITIRTFAASTLSPVGFLLKVMLDVFRYVGDPEYRVCLQQVMDTTIEDVRDRRESCSWYVIAHSLGTVIAVDSLVNSSAWKPADAVTLITFGSPLKRFFFRFFPNMLFPPSASECSRLIASRVGKFRWINCYRSRDYVGTTMGFGSEEYTLESKASNDKGFLQAHLNYWADAEVRRLVMTRLADAPFGALPMGTCAWSEVERPLDEGYRTLLDRVFWRLGLVIVILMPVVLAVNAGINVRNDIRVSLTRLQQLKTSGNYTLATVSYWTKYVPMGTQGAAMAANQFRFEYVDDLQQKHVWTSEIRMPGLFPSPGSERFGLEGLDRFAESHRQCDMDQPPTSRPCSLGQITIRYLKDDRSFFIVPKFPPPNPSNSLLFDAWWNLVVSVPVWASFGFLALWCCHKLFQLFIGHVSLGTPS